MEIQSVPLLDPRPPRQLGTTPLAPRPKSLRGRRVLLFDNGKLGPAYGHYRAIFTALRGELEARFPGVQVAEVTDDLLLGNAGRLWQAAEEVKADAVILALCDGGVSQPTAIVAGHLESRGIPTCVICTELGVGAVQAAVRTTVPGIPCVVLTAIRTTPGERVAAETEAIVPAVFAGLTTTPKELIGHSRNPAALGAPRLGDCLVLEAVRLVGEGIDPAHFVERFTDLMESEGLGDGFPLIPPTRERLTAMLSATDFSDDAEVMSPIPPRRDPVTVRDVALVAIMAGCRPTYFPVVLTAFLAMAHPEYRYFQANVTTHPSGNLVLVSGPLAAEIGIAAAHGCLGPGHRANASIGRAVNLAGRVLIGAIPGEGDLSLMGSPAEFSYCCAENLAQSPWDGLWASRFRPDVTTVTVCKCEGPRNVLDHLSQTPEGILTGIASTAATLGGNNAYRARELVVFLNPEHARICAEAGWTRADVQAFLFEAARIDRRLLQGRGVVPDWPAHFTALDRVPVVASPSNVLVAVAGAPGPSSQVAVPWGFSTAVTLPVSDSRGEPKYTIQPKRS